MKKDNINYKYLLRLYYLVDEYLADSKENYDNLPEVIVAFCVVVEKVLKIKLYKKNPVLVFDGSKFRDDDALMAIVNKKESDIETIRVREVIGRYKLLFNDEFSDDELQVLIDIYNIRNHFIHGYKSDELILLDRENIIKKMGTVWERVSNLVFTLFSKEVIKASRPKKPKQKYSEEELEEVLIEEVKKKIQSTKNEYGVFGFGDHVYQTPDYNSFLSFSGEKCPRCNSYGFSLNKPDFDMLSVTTIYSQQGFFSDLYRCKKCNLELTRKEYEVAKKLKDIKN